MKIGLLVDGLSEYYALPHLIPRLESPHTVLHQPLKCDIQPFASPAQIALAASKKFAILLSRGVSRIVILVDKETREDCTVESAQAIEREAAQRLAPLSAEAEARVVLKVSALENWLVADPAALQEMTALFENIERIERQVGRDRADRIPALDLLKRSCKKKTGYDKREEAIAICKKLDPNRAASNSRSFRKFLGTVGHPLPPAPKPRRARR